MLGTPSLEELREMNPDHRQALPAKVVRGKTRNSRVCPHLCGGANVHACAVACMSAREQAFVQMCACMRICPCMHPCVRAILHAHMSACVRAPLSEQLPDKRVWLSFVGCQFSAWHRDCSALAHTAVVFRQSLEPRKLEQLIGDVDTTAIQLVEVIRAQSFQTGASRQSLACGS